MPLERCQCCRTPSFARWCNKHETEAVQSACLCSIMNMSVLCLQNKYQQVLLMHLLNFR